MNFCYFCRFGVFFEPLLAVFVVLVVLDRFSQFLFAFLPFSIFRQFGQSWGNRGQSLAIVGESWAIATTPKTDEKKKKRKKKGKKREEESSKNATIKTGIKKCYTCEKKTVFSGFARFGVVFWSNCQKSRKIPFGWRLLRYLATNTKENHFFGLFYR